ncbi:FliH/SctL family protein [Pseudaeromonas pectinilytica]
MTTIFSLRDLGQFNTLDIYGSISGKDIDASNTLSADCAESELITAEKKIHALEMKIESLRNSIELVKQDGINEGKLRAQSELEEQYASLRLKENELIAQFSLLKQLSEVIDTSVGNVRDHFLSECYEIVFSAVLAIIGHDYSYADHRVTSMIETHLDKITTTQASILCVSPTDYRVLVANHDLMALLPKQLRLEELTQLQHGDILIKSAAGELDHRLQIKIEQFKNMLIEHAVE